MSEQSETFSDVVAERDAMVGFFRYLDGEIPGVLEDLEAIRGEGATAGQYEALAARVLDWARDDEQQELVQERDELQGRYDSMVASYAGRITELEADISLLRSKLYECGQGLETAQTETEDLRAACRDLERSSAGVEAECAAMRQALERCKAVFQDNEDWSFGPRVELAVDGALSSDAGHALLAELAALRQEMDAIRFAAHMPDDYEYGLASWINQHLYVRLAASGGLDADGQPLRRTADIEAMVKIRKERDQLLVLLAHYDGIGFADLDDWQRAAAICGVQHGVRFADLHADAVKRGRALVEGVKS